MKAFIHSLYPYSPFHIRVLPLHFFHVPFFFPFLTEIMTVSALVLEMDYTWHRKKLMCEAHLNRAGSTTYTK